MIISIAVANQHQNLPKKQDDGILEQIITFER
jgi:hypothetical protein